GEENGGEADVGAGVDDRLHAGGIVEVIAVPDENLFQRARVRGARPNGDGMIDPRHSDLLQPAMLRPDAAADGEGMAQAETAHVAPPAVEAILDAEASVERSQRVQHRRLE